MRGRAHHAYRGLLIAVPTVVSAWDDARLQILYEREWKPIEADDDPPLICLEAPPQYYRHGHSCDDDSVAADNGQRRYYDAGA